MKDDGLVGPPRFVMWPSPVLKGRAAEIETVDDGIRGLWAAMLAAMYAMPGVGLAAPQIGHPVRLAVMDCAPGKDGPVRLANPVILEASDETSQFEEASPNLPGAAAWIDRPAWVRVAYLDETGTAVERRFDGLWSTSVQHQIDHLDGKMFFDRLGAIKRRRLLERWRKTNKQASRATARRQ